jgi:sugar phosphate isomerase/epimerase
VENMTRDTGSRPTHIKAILDNLPEDVFVFCLDTGHAEMAKNETSAVEMIQTMGKRLQALHLHDCDQIRDNHGLPFTYKIDFDAVIEELKKVEYAGDVMLETGSFFVRVPDELLPVYTKTAVECAKYFREQLQNKNN